MIAVGINQPGGGSSSYLSVDASAFKAWDSNGATFKKATVTATDSTEVGFNVFTFDQTTEQGIQLALQNTNGYFKTQDFKARLKLRREAAGDANEDAIFKVVGRFVRVDPDVSMPGTKASETISFSREGDLETSEWIEVESEGTLNDTAILIIDVIRDATNASDNLDALVQLVNVEFEFNQ